MTAPETLQPVASALSMLLKRRRSESFSEPCSTKSSDLATSRSIQQIGCVDTEACSELSRYHQQLDVTAHVPKLLFTL